MCYTCGCRMPYDDMGHEDNLTEKDFELAGVTEAIGKEGKLKAKQNMLELLKKQIDAEELDNPKNQY